MLYKNKMRGFTSNRWTYIIYTSTQCEISIVFEGEKSMSVLCFDIGGSAVKYGLFHNENLIEQAKFTTPVNWELMVAEMQAVKKKFEETHILSGVAISSPGAVNQVTGMIDGASAVPYIHHFEINKALENALGLPVTIENDANCSGLAEVAFGVAKNEDSALFIVLGTGVGGCLIIDNKVHHGHQLHGGEFGYMLLDGERSFSELGSAVNMARRYNEVMLTDLSGEEVFAAAVAGDEVALKEVETFYHYLALGIYNLQHAFDPACIVIGGGVSAKADLVAEVNHRIQAIKATVEIATLTPDVRVCQYHNDANLLGAVVNFKQLQK